MKYLLFFLTIFILNGCWQEKTQEEVKTVEWYKNNPKDRMEKISQCLNNPGELGETPNCINAQKAKALSMSDKPASKW